MIARSWRATATPDGARWCEEHFHTTVLPELRAVPGFCMAYLMRRAGDSDSEDTVQLHVLTFWESMAAITNFASNRPQAAVVDPAAQALLLNFDQTVDHYEAQLHHRRSPSPH
jgi:heme-degrading monooxygenase HmoA